MENVPTSLAGQSWDPRSFRFTRHQGVVTTRIVACLGFWILGVVLTQVIKLVPTVRLAPETYQAFKLSYLKISNRIEQTKIKKKRLAPRNTFVHWLLFQPNPTLNSRARVLKGGVVQGEGVTAETVRIPRKDWGTLGKIRGIKPPPLRILLYYWIRAFCTTTPPFPSASTSFRSCALAHSFTHIIGLLEIRKSVHTVRIYGTGIYLHGWLIFYGKCR